MDRVLEHLFVQVDKAYREGANILILSDRGVDENHVAIPSLLAVSAVHKHLVKTKNVRHCPLSWNPASRGRCTILRRC